MPPGQGGRLSLTIEMSTQTPGIEGPDRHWLFYPLGTAARTPAHGWVELPFPRENFRVYGIPDAWRTVKQLTFELSGFEHLLLGPLSLRRRRRAVGPRLTDAALFQDELHLARPGLEDVRRAAGGGDFAAAGRALCDYFRARREPRRFYGQPKGGPVDLENARRILKHFICGQQLGAEIDWYANPIGYVGWMNELNRHSFLRDLVHAYLATGDDAYVAELDALLASWIAANPSPIGNNGGFYPAWQTLSTAIRVYGSWLEVF
ncbi:MAG TPA: heparinase II/III family protein, partial [Vicinamibacteria bacterium]|nr:heparinase II/III family protein [Vicinamibacteria bacterium]